MADTDAQPEARAADTLRTIVCVPTYNERENVVLLCEAILEQGSAIDILVVDDNSPDGTSELVEQMEDPRVHLKTRPGKLGLGTAHIAAFRWALERDYERIITMDADFSHPPDRIPAMLEASRWSTSRRKQRNAPVQSLGSRPRAARAS